MKLKINHRRGVIKHKKRLAYFIYLYDINVTWTSSLVITDRSSQTLKVRMVKSVNDGKKTRGHFCIKYPCSYSIFVYLDVEANNVSNFSISETIEIENKQCTVYKQTISLTLGNILLTMITDQPRIDYTPYGVSCNELEKLIDAHSARTDDSFANISLSQSIFCKWIEVAYLAKMDLNPTLEEALKDLLMLARLSK